MVRALPYILLSFECAYLFSGGMAGSLGLNTRFLDAIRALVGDEQWIGLKNSKALAVAEKQFDQEIKRKFVGSLGDEYFVNFPKANLEDDDDNDLDQNCWTLTGYFEILKDLWYTEPD
jgi:hypothetical protein